MATAPRFDGAFRDEFRSLLRWRRDVRHFADRPVADDLFDALIATASFAPSVGLSEPWRFVIVDDPVCRAAIRANFVASNAAALERQSGDRAALYAGLKLAGLDQAPRQFAVFVDPDPAQGSGLGRATMPEAVGYSAVMAVHTLWLAATAAGLGLGWVSIIDPVAVARALEIPGTWRLIGYFCLGYPAEESATPELERSGWERRHPVQVLRR